MPLIRIFITFILLISIISITTGQCFEDRHNSTIANSWVSCSMSQSPDENDSTPRHWINFDLGYEYELHNLKVWNYNHIDNLDYGARDIRISVSLDGNEYSSIGMVTLPMAEGSSFYQGMDLIDLGGIEARYILLTVLSNYGGGCVGLGELRVDLQSAGTVPIELLSFEVTQYEKDGILDWISSKEVNASHYDIERSFDADDWEVVGVESIEYDSYQEREYNFIDRGIANYLSSGELVYYRIKMVDLDGSHKYSDTKSLSFEESRLQAMQVYPNPSFSAEQRYVQVNSSEEKTIELNILDNKGAIISSSNVYISKGNNQLELSTGNLSNGLYYVYAGEEMITEFVIQE